MARLSLVTFNVNGIDVESIAGSQFPGQLISAMRRHELGSKSESMTDEFVICCLQECWQNWDALSSFQLAVHENDNDKDGGDNEAAMVTSVHSVGKRNNHEITAVPWLAMADAARLECTRGATKAGVISLASCLAVLLLAWVHLARVVVGCVAMLNAWTPAQLRWWNPWWTWHQPLHERLGSWQHRLLKVLREANSSASMTEWRPAGLVWLGPTALLAFHRHPNSVLSPWTPANSTCTSAAWSPFHSAGAVGVGGWLASWALWNKGGVGLRLQTSAGLAIWAIGVHLNAHQGRAQRRYQDLLTVLSELGSLFEWTTPSSSTSGGVCVVLGDFNFRPLLAPTESPSQVRTDWSDWLFKDEFLLARSKGDSDLYSALEEAPISFAPTYKYYVGGSKWGLDVRKRAPAWCDRVLTLQLPGSAFCLRTERYEALHNIHDGFSDHRPVMACMAIQPADSTITCHTESVLFSSRPLHHYPMTRLFLGWVLGVVFAMAKHGAMLILIPILVLLPWPFDW